MTTSTQSTRGVGEFNGKRVLVTGGTKGAGKAIADRFLQRRRDRHHHGAFRARRENDKLFYPG